MPLGVATGKRMYVVALCNFDRDKVALVEIYMETGNEVEVYYSKPDVEIDHGGYSSDRGDMAYATYATWKQQRHFLDRKTEQVYGAIGKKLAGYEIDILDRDTARNRFIVRASTDNDPGAIYYYDMAGNALVKLTDDNPALRDCLLERKSVE